MKELTQQELIRVFSAYLPYDLEFICETDNENYLLTNIQFIDEYPIWACNRWNYESLKYAPEINSKPNGQLGTGFKFNQVKPILWHLSMLTKEIEHEGGKFIPMQRLSKEFEMNVIEHCFLEQNAPIKGFDWLRSTSYPVVQRLIEWHFNIFNLDESQYINKATCK